MTKNKYLLKFPVMCKFRKKSYKIPYLVKHKYFNINLLFFIKATEKYPNINLNFNKKLVSGKVEKGEMLMTE